MKDPERFWIMFILLDQCYFATQTAETDGLGGLLGAIDPDLWEDALPADPAILHDWEALPAAGPLTQNAMRSQILLFLGNGGYADAFSFSLAAVQRWLDALTPAQYAAARREAAEQQAAWQARRDAWLAEEKHC